MGTIFEGEQEEPRRAVAVKVLRPGMVSADLLRRFQYESQILARLRHPGIAQVYQAGTQGEGEDAFPYFAMEYIPNAKPITEYAVAKRLGIRERLELFARVCDAVHYGHQKGVVHRDLKPSNILVDSNGNPRIIDFGIARATDSDLALATFHTQVGQIMGSLQYMSPEQFDADPHDIDTRSDVYALGVVLYELLSGKPPYDMGRTALHEAARIVREETPRRLGDTDPALKGDLATLVHKALEKDRDQRYQSAYGLALDIRRYLAGEPIAARPPSLSYQMRIFARRNKGLLAAVTGIFVILVAGVVVSTSLYVHAEHQRERAERQTAKAEAATEFLRTMLSEWVPHGFGSEVTIADMLDLSKENVAKAFQDDPEVEADVCQTLGWGYLNVDRWDDSEEQLKRALALRSQTLGRDDPATLETLDGLSVLYTVAGRYADLVEVDSWIRDSRERILGRDAPETIQAEYELAEALWGLGRLDEAEAAAARAIEGRKRVLGDTHPETLKAYIRQAAVQLSRGRAAEAELMGREILSSCEGSLGRDHDVTRAARSQLAATLVSEGKLPDAAALYHRPAPDEFGILDRFQGDLQFDPSKAYLLVFWETWCPYSQRAVPKLEDYYLRYRSRGVDVVGLSRVTRTSTPEKVRSFIAQKGISFPILRTNDQPWSYFGVQGTPWVILVWNGEMVWERFTDTPEAIPAGMFEGLVGSPTGE